MIMAHSKIRTKIASLSRFRVRIRFIALLFVLAAFLCIARLYYLQVLQGRYYAERALNEFTLPSTSLFDRGTIYFTTKDGAHIAAATMQDGVALGLDPQELSATSTETVYEKLNAAVPLVQSDFFAKAAETNEVYVPLIDHLSTTTGAMVQALSLPGVIVTADRWRYYPGGTLAAQTLGFLGYGAGNILEGQYGLEREYETLLERNDSDMYTNFFVQLFAGAESTLTGQGEGDVVTSIEPSVQAELERELALYMTQWHPTMSGGIIMDPQTGAIVAMGTLPSFDPNSLAQSDPTAFKNRLVSDSYEMGSIMKPLTMAAGIDTGAITPTSTYDDTGCIYLSNYPICNYDHKARGPNTSMQTILSDSLNVGASFIATQVGPERMREYFIDHYGFGSTTGIDLPDEAAGIVDNLYRPQQLYYDEAAFGQGIAVTPVQMTRDLAILANGGYLVTPHVASSIINAEGIEVPVSVSAPRQVLQPQTVTDVDQMLTTVVDTVLAGGKVHMDHYSIAAKTGTAQIAKPGGGYYANTYLHSYFGFFPSYHARFIIFLYALKPVGAPYASETWSGVFEDLTHFLIDYYQIPPDR